MAALLLPIACGLVLSCANVLNVISLLLLLAALVQSPPAPVTVVHFELYHNRVYVPVMANGGGPFQMVLDTGASASGLSPARARELSLDV